MMEKVIKSFKKGIKKTSDVKSKKTTIKKMNSGMLLPMIEKRAYEIWESRGYFHGGDQNDWCQAEQEVLKFLSKQ